MLKGNTEEDWSLNQVGIMTLPIDLILMNLITLPLLFKKIEIEELKNLRFNLMISIKMKPKKQVNGDQLLITSPILIMVEKHISNGSNN